MFLLTELDQLGCFPDSIIDDRFIIDDYDRKNNRYRLILGNNHHVDYPKFFGVVVEVKGRNQISYIHNKNFLHGTKIGKKKIEHYFCNRLHGRIIRNNNFYDYYLGKLHGIVYVKNENYIFKGNYHYGSAHKIGKPAIKLNYLSMDPYLTKSWYQFGKLHNPNGPSYIRYDNYEVRYEYHQFNILKETIIMNRKTGDLIRGNDDRYYKFSTINHIDMFRPSEERLIIDRYENWVRHIRILFDSLVIKTYYFGKLQDYEISPAVIKVKKDGTKILEEHYHHGILFNYNGPSRIIYSKGGDKRYESYSDINGNKIKSKHYL